MKTYRFITILTLLAISITAEAQDKHILDSMRREVSKASTDTGRIDTRLGIAYYYLNDSYDIGRLDTAERYLEQANKLNRKHDTPEIQNLGNLCYALLYSFRNPDEDPKKRFLPVIAACHKTGDKEDEMLAWGYLAYFTKKSPASSPFRLICYEKEMALAHQQIGDEYQEMFDLNEIADIHTLQKKYSLAESELFQVIKRSKQAGSHNVMAAYDLLGEV